VYTNNVPSSTTVKTDYIVGALRKFLKAFHQNGLTCCLWSGPNCPKSKGVPGKKSPLLLPHTVPFNLPTLSLLTFSSSSLCWEGAGRPCPKMCSRWSGKGTLTKDDFTMAFYRWQDHGEKCVPSSVGCVKNGEKGGYFFIPTVTVFLFLAFCTLLHMNNSSGCCHLQTYISILSILYCTGIRIHMSKRFFYIRKINMTKKRVLRLVTRRSLAR
jgi:hypothetical protein